VKQLKPWLAAVAVLVMGIVLLVGSTLIRFENRHADEPARYGVSFAPSQAHYLGVEPEQVFDAAVDDLGARHFRLMGYWDEVEAKQGEYNFGQLDWQFEKAAKAGVTVSLTLGRRQPHWPECHDPSWIKDLGPKQTQQALDSFISAVVTRYRNAPALESYQLENEALNRGAGECPEFSRTQLLHEYRLVKQLDDKHPVYVTMSDEAGFPVWGTFGDGIGFSIYGTYFYQGSWGNKYVSYPNWPWYQKLRAALIEAYTGRPVFIHELQAEPWGPDDLADLSAEEQAKSMSPAQLNYLVNFVKSTGIKRTDLWGVEWWYQRKQKHNDPGMWDTAKPLFSTAAARH
jgi:hypothetical protein